MMVKGTGLLSTPLDDDGTGLLGQPLARGLLEAAPTPRALSALLAALPGASKDGGLPRDRSDVPFGVITVPPDAPDEARAGDPPDDRTAVKAPSPVCTGGYCERGGSWGNKGMLPHPLKPGQFLCPSCAFKLFDILPDGSRK